MYTPIMKNKIIPSVVWIYWLKSLDITSLEPTNQNSIKVPKFFGPTNKVMLLQNFGYQKYLQCNVPSLPVFHLQYFKLQEFNVKITLSFIKITVFHNSILNNIFLMEYSICIHIHFMTIFCRIKIKKFIYTAKECLSTFG